MREVVGEVEVEDKERSERMKVARFEDTLKRYSVLLKQYLYGEVPKTGEKIMGNTLNKTKGKVL